MWRGEGENCDDLCEEHVHTIQLLLSHTFIHCMWLLPVYYNIHNVMFITSNTVQNFVHIRWSSIGSVV